MGVVLVRGRSGVSLSHDLDHSHAPCFYVKGRGLLYLKPASYHHSATYVRAVAAQLASWLEQCLFSTQDRHPEKQYAEVVGGSEIA